MREAVRQLYGRSGGAKLALLARSLLRDEYFRVNSICGGGFVCPVCRRHYCRTCGGKMGFECCRVLMLIATEYLGE